MTPYTLVSCGFRTLSALGLAAALSACASSAPRQQVQAPPPPAAMQPPAAPVQPQAQPRPPQTVEAPIPNPSTGQIAIAGTAFPVDGTAGRVPPGSRLVVRVYDAAGGDVNIRVAEGAFSVAEGIPARYKVPAPASAVKNMDLPAVAARVEGPRGSVIYRNETAVLLQAGRAGDIPMTLQRVRPASNAAKQSWITPAAE